MAIRHIGIFVPKNILHCRIYPSNTMNPSVLTKFNSSGGGKCQNCCTFAKNQKTIFAINYCD